MAIQITSRQFEQLGQDERKVVVVQDPRTKQKFVVVPENMFNRARVLFEYITMRSEAEASATAADAWSEKDNERRVALINKKHETQLTPAEKRELEELQQRAYQHRERVAPMHNEVLRLLVEALEQEST